MYYQCNTSVTSCLYFCSVNGGHDHIPRWHISMDKEKAERIIKIVNWVRYIILAVFLTFVFVALSKAQTTHDFGVWYSAGMEKKINLVLVFIDDNFVLTHIGYGGHLFTAHCRFNVFLS